MSYREYRSPQRIIDERRRHGRHSNSNIILSAPDKSLIIIVVFLVIIGFLAIFSATAPKCMREGTNLASYLIKQAIFGGVGFFAMGFFAKFDYKKLEKYNLKFMWAVIIMLFIVKFTPLGMEINGAKRWINLGFMQLQPSEFAKPLFCMLLASMFKDKIDMSTVNKNMPVIFAMLFILFLILKQPNLSMAIILCVTTFGLYLAGRGPWQPTPKQIIIKTITTNGRITNTKK